MLKWNELKDSESISWGEIQLEEQFEEWKKKLVLMKMKKLIDIFFEHFFPCAKVHTKLL